MSETIMSDLAAASNLIMNTEEELVKCDCCGLTEECTAEYIYRVRKNYDGKWICGLCAEAVKDEISRSPTRLSTEEALNLHLNFRRNFISSGSPENSSLHFITAVRQILRRSLDSPRAMRSTPNSPSRSGREMSAPPMLVRSESCFSALSG